TPASPAGALIMNCRTLPATLIVAASLFVSAPAALAQADGAGSAGPFARAPAQQQNRIVMQVSDADPAKWNLALNNAHNLQTDLGAKNVDIEIVAYGPGIGMLKADSVVGNRIDEAQKSGVKVV